MTRDLLLIGAAIEQGFRAERIDAGQRDELLELLALCQEQGGSAEQLMRQVARVAGSLPPPPPVLLEHEWREAA